MNEKTLEQIKADIRKSIKQDSEQGLHNAFWAHIIHITWSI